MTMQGIRVDQDAMERATQFMLSEEKKAREGAAQARRL